MTFSLFLTTDTLTHLSLHLFIFSHQKQLKLPKSWEIEATESISFNNTITIACSESQGSYLKKNDTQFKFGSS